MVLNDSFVKKPSTMASSEQDVNMAKLQKRVIREQRQTSQSRAVVTKLTPAEIRSLNNSVVSFKNGDKHFYQATTPIQSRRLSSNTPPLTPEYAMANRKHLSHRSGVNLPTPPHSPDHVYQQRRNSNPVNGYAHIHAPKPRAYTTAQFVNRVPVSRPSSASSYRGVTTYRDPEIIRSGSMTMLHQPPPDIVSNPLSQFSRPRRSQTVASLDRNGSRHSAIEPNSQVPKDEQERLERNNSRPSSRTTSSPQKSNSFVSDRDMKSTGALSDIGRDGFEGTTTREDLQPENVGGVMMNRDGSAEAQPHVSNWSWRRSMSQQRAEEKDEAALKKIRRHTMSFSMRSNSTHSIAYSDTKPGAAPILRDTLKGELPSEKAAMFKDQAADMSQAQRSSMFAPHPSVRPLSLQIPMQQTPSPVEVQKDQKPVSVDSKGKGKEVDAAPVYGRCSCCGKLKKPNAFHSELSPVIENENLRTNFSLEADRTSVVGKKRSSSLASSNKQRYTPIIPMPVGADRTVQASIEPHPEARMDEGNGTFASSSGPANTSALGDGDPDLVRFSSLRAKTQKALESQGDDKTTGNVMENMNTTSTSGTSSLLPAAVETRPEPEVITNGLSSNPAMSEGLQTDGGNSIEQQVNQIPVSTEPAELEQPQEMRGRLLQRSKAEEITIQSKPKTDMTNGVTAEEQLPQPAAQIMATQVPSKPESSHEQDQPPVSMQIVERSAKISGDQAPVQKQEASTANKSQYRTSGLSMFRRHRKSRSLPQTATPASKDEPLPQSVVDPVPATATESASKADFDISARPASAPRPAVGSNGALVLPIASITSHHLVTVPPSTSESKIPVAILEPKKTEKTAEKANEDDARHWSELLSANTGNTLAKTSEPQLQTLGQVRSPPSSRLQAHLRQQGQSATKPHGTSKLSRTVKFSQESIQEDLSPKDEVGTAKRQPVLQPAAQQQEQIQAEMPMVSQTDSEATPRPESRVASQIPADIDGEHQLLPQSLDQVERNTQALPSSMSSLPFQPPTLPTSNSQSPVVGELRTPPESPMEPKGVQSQPELATGEPPEYPQLTLDLLPIPQLGPHFTRSSSTLRNYVISRQQSSSNLVGAVLATSENKNGYSHDYGHVSGPPKSLITGIYDTRESATTSPPPNAAAAATVGREHEHGNIYSKGREISLSPSERLRQEVKRSEIMDEERIAREKLFAEVMAI